MEDLPKSVLVPDLVGLNYDEATSLRRNEGLHIADPNPDAPPITNFWWEHQGWVVLTQHPQAGEQIDRHASVIVTLGLPGEAVGARVGGPPLPMLSGQVVPDGGGEYESRRHASD